MIDFDSFLRWAEKHFTDVEVHKDEIKVNSPFCQDDKKHLWCNPKKNAYHCWKSGESGNLLNLVCRVSGCSHEEAIETLDSDNDLRLLEERLHNFFTEKKKKPVKISKIALPPNTYLISKLANSFRHVAEKYISSRKLSLGRLLFCISGKYRNRVIIPYYNQQDELIYWNARDITGRSAAKYLGPDADDVNVGKEDVIFAETWPKKGEMVHLTEGEFDAMSINQSGLFGMACGGKEVFDKQIDMLRLYKVCISFDTDKSGAQALNKVGDKLISNGIQEVYYIRPPVGMKDWNQMLVSFGTEEIKNYISNKRKPFTPWTSNILRLGTLP